jgi:hypothetical protein
VAYLAIPTLGPLRPLRRHGLGVERDELIRAGQLARQGLRQLHLLVGLSTPEQKSIGAPE